VGQTLSDVRSLLRFGGELSAVDTRATPGVKSRKKAEAAFGGDAAELAQLQERLAAEGTRSVVLLLQGMDTCGKDGTVKHVVGQVNPAGLRITSFKKPTKEELSHDFLWRIRRALPDPGYLGIFNRSQYEDVLIVRVHGLAEWEGRYAEINRFEAKAGVTWIKCMLHISRDEQRERLLARLADPTKRWKFNVGDLTERERWDDYAAAYQDALARCDTDAAPWHVVPADRKWYRNWAIQQLLLETLRELDPQYPEREDLDVPALEKKLSRTS
jgi:PPK2 family polyphosphate:nucleotide phosphotransferase